MLVENNPDKSGFWCVAKKMIHNYFFKPGRRPQSRKSAWGRLPGAQVAAKTGRGEGGLLCVED